MNIDQLIEYLQSYQSFSENVRLWMRVDAFDGTYTDYPDGVEPNLVARYRTRGIERLYAHQREVFDRVRAGDNVVVVTPTASGKTLCYNLPVIDAIAKNPEARALYLFPTKALSQDQLAELNAIVEDTGIELRTYTFDGDTPASARKAVKAAGNIVITNPDMLHAGILPHHTIWIKLFENLKYIVIDEIHSYSGVFGSHFANLMRRLHRICAFYGSRPQFICCSATIRNPKEHAEALIGRECALVNNNGAPRGERHYVIYNPPVVNEQLGIRASAVKEAAKVGSFVLLNKIPTIVFARSRMRVEIVSTYLRHKCPGVSIVGYRGGYLPTERRRIEQGLRAGSITGVVSTNALELGLDIGMLDVAITVGYPGSISSLHQQFGRAGRRGNKSLAIMVATSSPLDQYIANNPDYIVKSNPESATINPDNLLILMDHLKCAAFELPFHADERFSAHLGSTRDMLDYLAERGVLKRAEDTYHWMSDIYPANEISLRTAAQENFLIINDKQDKTLRAMPDPAGVSRRDPAARRNPKVIGEVDYYSAATLIHEDAIYIHQGRQFFIDTLDWEGRMAFCHEVESDYYTDAETKTDIHVLEKFEERSLPIAVFSRGEITVRTTPVMFKKIKFDTHENLGWGKIHLPEIEMHTAAAWLDIDEERLHAMAGREIAGRVLYGAAYLLRNIAPIYTLSDVSDVRVQHQARSNYSGKPAIFIYDSTPGGVGLSERVYAILDVIAAEAVRAIEVCECRYGCPGCVGPLPANDEHIKRLTAAFLRECCGEHQGQA